MCIIRDCSYERDAAPYGTWNSCLPPSSSQSSASSHRRSALTPATPTSPARSPRSSQPAPQFERPRAARPGGVSCSRAGRTLRLQFTPPAAGPRLASVGPPPGLRRASAGPPPGLRWAMPTWWANQRVLCHFCPPHGPFHASQARNPAVLPSGWAGIARHPTVGPPSGQPERAATPCAGGDPLRGRRRSAPRGGA